MLGCCRFYSPGEIGRVDVLPGKIRQGGVSSVNSITTSSDAANDIVPSTRVRSALPRTVAVSGEATKVNG